MMRILRSLSHLVMLLALAPLTGMAAEGYKVTTEHYQSGGRKIKVQVYKPESPGKHAPVVVLHGSGGMLFDGPEMKRVARDLAIAGHDVYLLHYFNRTRHLFVTGKALERHFPAWLETVKDGVAWVTSTRKDGQKVGIFGYSLGGFLAVSEAAHDPKIGAAIPHAGGIWRGQDQGVNRVAPLLIIHGKQDVRVPFPKYVPPMLALAKKHGSHVETAFYESESHRFTEASLKKVREESVAFLQRQWDAKPVRRKADKRP